MKGQYKTIDDYIKSYPESVQAILEKIRQTIRRVAPEATELISYQMPAFEQNGVLVWFGAFKKHIGFYPKASGIEAFQKELSPYKLSKGSIQFPLDNPIPYDLIDKIVEFRVKENLSQEKGRRTY
jgi:uncharacterized protein YdhG (YjbR/CyaY superfamily)